MCIGMHERLWCTFLMIPLVSHRPTSWDGMQSQTLIGYDRARRPKLASREKTANEAATAHPPCNPGQRSCEELS